MIRCARLDQSAITIRVYYLQHGSATLGFSHRRQEFLIPIGIVIKALVETNEWEIYERLTAVQKESKKGSKGAVGTQFVSQRARIILEEVRRHALFTRHECLEFIGERFRPVMDVSNKLPAAAVGEKVLADFVLCHLDNPSDKLNLLIFMLQKLFALVDGTAAPDNADALQHQEVLLPGHLLTIVVKDRMQDWLTKVKGQLNNEMKEKPAQFDLQDFNQVQKMFERVPPSDISKKVEYLLNTGNLVSQSGLDLMQVWWH
jgi:DNA-directed RNA polymerase I subunit RPA2